MRPTALLVLALCLTGTLAKAQELRTADFTGSWKMDPTRSESAVQGQGGQSEIRISQARSQLRIETIRDGKSDTALYPIGERPTMSTEVTGERRAFWDGPALVNEGSVDVQDRTVAFLEARTLSADKSEMTVETTLKMEHGYELKGAQTVVKGKNVFIRAR